MADEEATANIMAKADKDVGSLGTFDPTKKKKKKKKERVGEEDVDVQEEVAAVAEGVSQLSVNENGESAGDGGLDFGKKKKKKKPQASKEGEGEDGAEGAEEDGDATAAEGGEGMELSLEKKKKKKKKQRAEGDELPGEEDEDGKGEGKGEDEDGAKEAEEEEEGEEQGDDDEEAEGIDLGPPKMPWEGTDRDYLYEELLGRVFNILRQNNPELAGDRRRTIMRPPQVLREGTKKTVFVNFMDLCKIMHRQPEHVMAFLLVELGTSGSLDGQQRLVVKGRFAPKNFEGILRRYVNEYLMCNGCKSPDTILSKENRLFFLRCEQCGSHRSVAPIKAGFVAQVGKRVKTG